MNSLLFIMGISFVNIMEWSPSPREKSELSVPPVLTIPPQGLDPWRQAWRAPVAAVSSLGPRRTLLISVLSGPD